MLNPKNTVLLWRNLRLKRYFKFILGRYLEFGILAIMPFWLAYNVSPEEYGQLLSVVILTQFSSFFCSIVSTVYLKSVIAKIKYGQGLVGTILFGFSIVIIVSVTLESKFVLLAIIASLLNLIRGIYQGYLRGRDRISELSSYNIIYPVFFLLLYALLTFLFVHSVEIYLLSQIAGLLVSYIYIYIDCTIDIKEFSLSLCMKQNYEQKKLLIQYFFINFVSYFILQSDKVLLYYNSDNIQLQGQYLFFDNLSNVYYFSLSAISYALLHKIIFGFKNSDISYHKLLFFWFFFVVLIGGLALFISKSIVLIFYKSYLSYFEIFPYMILNKILLLTQFISVAFYMSKDRERSLIIVQVIPVLSIVLCGVYWKSPITYLHYLSLCLFTINLLLYIGVLKYKKVLQDELS